MTLSYNWLSQYLPQPIPLPELCTILTRIGLEVEGTETTGNALPDLHHFVVGKVETCIPHPNAERLKLTTVNVGNGEPRQIVCGAPNVAVGETVIVALPGAEITPKDGAPFTIKKSKLRGEVSEGMLCSAAEIGASDDASGLLLMDEKWAAGTPATDCFPKGESDTAIHVGLTPNRADAASHMGTARDVCAYMTHHSGEEWRVKTPKTVALPTENSAVKITNNAPEDCFRYAATSVENITVSESPGWLQARLRTIGVRPINNVVDITNYVLHETGHPLHAFDAAKISGGEILIRRAQKGETFTTLDGAARMLDETDLLICDREKPVALAGVMGGKDSGVGESTTSVLLECAVFRPSVVRNSSMRHGLRSEAATHFEKGIDFEDMPFVVSRALALLEEIAGGKAVGMGEEISQTSAQKTISLSLAQVQSLSGKPYTPEAVGSILGALGFVLSEKENNTWNVTVPAYKTDISLPADLVEEILRIDGLDEIPLPETVRIPRAAQRPTDRALKEKAARLLAGMGFSEILTNSIINSRWFPQEPRLIKMCNALSQDLDALRPSLLESGLTVLEYNLNRKATGLSLFETGTVYHLGDGANSYHETPQLALWQTGGAGLSDWKKTHKQTDVFSLRGVVENLFKAFGLEPETRVGEGRIGYLLNGAELGFAEEVSPQKAAAFGVKETVFFAAINWRLLTGAATTSVIRFSELPKLPAIERDLSLVVNDDVPYGLLEKTTHENAPALLRHFHLFDVFQNEKLGEGKKSFAVRYQFQPGAEMPTDEAIDGWMKTLAGAYEKAFGATIRLG